MGKRREEVEKGGLRGEEGGEMSEESWEEGGKDKEEGYLRCVRGVVC